MLIRLISISPLSTALPIMLSFSGANISGKSVKTSIFIASYLVKPFLVDKNRAVFDIHAQNHVL